MWVLVMILAYSTKVTDGSSLAMNLWVGATMALFFAAPVWAVIFLWHFKKAYAVNRSHNEKKVCNSEKASTVPDNVSAHEKQTTIPAYERWKTDICKAATEFRFHRAAEKTLMRCERIFCKDIAAQTKHICPPCGMTDVFCFI